MKEHAADPGKRQAQHLLASEVLELVHGPEQAAATRTRHQALRNPSLASISQATPLPTDDSSGSSATAETQRAVLPSSLVLKTPLSRVLYHAGIVSTKSEGARSIAKGAVYLAQTASPSADDASIEGSTEPAATADGLRFVQVRDQRPDEVSSYITNGMLIFRIGKWKVRVIEVTEDAEFDRRGLDAPGWAEYKAATPRK